MTTCIVIPCCAPKLSHKCKAKDLYQSNFFRMAKKIAIESGFHWYILSAKYGLIHPEDIIEPYNILFQANGRTMYTGGIKPSVLSKEERTKIKLIANKILIQYNRRIYIMGNQYINGLLPGETPLLGSRGIGDQLSRLKELTYE